MGEHSAAELGTSYDCKAFGCTREARSTRGVYAYCDEHRAAEVWKEKPEAPKPTRGTFSEKVRELERAAKAADRARTEATNLTERALKAKAEADARERELRALAAELATHRDPAANGHS